MRDIVLENEAETEAWAQRFAATLKRGDCIALHGEMGSGKTALARACIRSLTQPDMPVPSPTFTLAQPYDITLSTGEPATLTHFDLYRLKRPEELDEIGLDDAIEHGIALIEWPEIASERLPPSALHLHLSHAGETARRLRIEGTRL